MRDSINYPPFPERSFTYRNEQVRADEVQREIVFSNIRKGYRYRNQAPKEWNLEQWIR
jgi:hypothetical protein